MCELIRFLLPVLISLSAMAPLYADVPASDGSAMALFRACRDAGSGVRDAVDPLLRAGWMDVTSTANWQRVIAERTHMLVRARLSSASYPEPWDDGTVRHSFPSTVARNMEEVVAYARRNIEAELQPFEPRTEFVLAAPSGKAIAAILHYPQHLVCEIVEQSEQDPGIRDRFHSRWPRARERGARGQRFCIDDRQVAIVILSPHAQQADERLPVDFDMSAWMRFEKNPDNKDPFSEGCLSSD